MSSSASRDWSLELKPPWVAIALLLGWLLFLLLATWESAIPVAGRLASGLAVVSFGIPAVCSQLVGLLPGALHRVSRLADGSWLLRDGTGREWAAELLPQSRMLPRCALLLWGHGGGLSWVLVQAGRHNRGEYRQLRVCLRWGWPKTLVRGAGAGPTAAAPGAC